MFLYSFEAISNYFTLGNSFGGYREGGRGLDKQHPIRNQLLAAKLTRNAQVESMLSEFLFLVGDRFKVSISEQKKRCNALTENQAKPHQNWTQLEPDFDRFVSEHYRSI